MSWADALTNPELLYGGGAIKPFNSTQDALNAALPLLLQNANGIGVTLQPPTSSTITPPPSDPTQPPAQQGADPQPPTLQTQGGGPALSTPSASGIPFFLKPTFQQAEAQTPTDSTGLPVAKSPGLSKLGMLASILHGSIQGGVDAMASGALNAAPGKSGFGAGIAGAVQMPIERAQIARQNALAQQEYALKGAQATQAQAAAQKDIRQANIVTPRQGGGVYDISQQDWLPGASPQEKQQKFESLQQALAARVLQVQQAGGDPMKDSQAEQLRDQITSIQKASNGATPLSKEQAAALNATWDPIAQKSGLPAGQFREGMPSSDATQLQTAIGGAIGKQQGAQTLVIRNQMADSMLNRNMQPSVDMKVGSPTYGQQVWATPGMIEAEPGRYTPSRYDPNTQAQVTVAKSVAGGPIQNNIVSFNQLLGHVGALSGAINDLRNTQSPLINKPMNWLSANAAGHPEVSNFLAQALPVINEYAAFLKNNKALKEDEVKEFNQILNVNSSPAQIDGALKKIAETAAIRLSAQNSSVKRTTHQDIPDLVDPNAQAALDHYGVKIPDYGNAPVKGAAPQGAPVQNWDATAIGPNGHQIGARGGKWYDVQTGKAIQ